MRKLVESTFVTLDGRISNPQDWSSPYSPEPASPIEGIDVTHLELVETTPFASGIVVHTHAPK